LFDEYTHSHQHQAEQCNSNKFTFATMKIISLLIIGS
jgi:hypothetical protein